MGPLSGAQLQRWRSLRVERWSPWGVLGCRPCAVQEPEDHKRFILEDKIQDPSKCLFQFSLRGNVMGQKVEMVDSVDDFKSSRSIQGQTHFPNFEMLDARIAPALNKIIQNSHFKKKVSLESRKPKKEDRFLCGRQIAFTIYDYFRVTGAHDTVLDYADFFSVTLHGDYSQEFDARWDEVLLSMSKILSDVILESLYNWEYVSLINSKPYWNCTTWRCIRRYRFTIFKNWRQLSRET